MIVRKITRPLVSVLQVGSSLGSREQLRKFECMYNSIKCVMKFYEKVRNWVDPKDMLIEAEKYPEPGTPTSPGMGDGAPSSEAQDLASAFEKTTPTGRPITASRPPLLTKPTTSRVAKPVCTDTPLTVASNGVPANSER